MKRQSFLPALAYIFCAFLVLGSLNCGAGESNPREVSLQPSFSVGYRVLDFKHVKDQHEEILTVAVWYPTAAEPKTYNYGGPTKGKVALDAAPLAEKEPYPMLVFSHGYGGSGLGAVFFTERLAARGWIVVAPDHHDRHSAVRIRIGQNKEVDRWSLLHHAKEIASSSPADQGKYLYRLDEMKLTIDGMLNSPAFSNLIDKERIAVGGHSFGGFTALGLCGTIKKCHDHRIKAVLLFSTGAGGYLFTRDELRSVKMPSMLFLGEREKQQARGDCTMSEIADKLYQDLPSPKYFIEVKGASHFSFNNRFSDTRITRLMSGTNEQFEVIRRYSIAFLEKHVVGMKGADDVLERTDPMFARYLSEPLPGVQK